MRRRTVVDPTFPMRLRESRAARNMSQQELALAAYTSKSHISELEHGKKRPTPRVARALDGALDAGGNLSQLVTETEIAVDPVGRAPGGGVLRREADEEADSVRRRQLLKGLAAVAGGATVSGVSLETLRHSVAATVDADRRDWYDIAADYARDFYTTSPSSLLDQLGVDLAVLRDLLAAAPATDLSRTAGQLSAVMAMTLASLGQPMLARRWWRTARKQADASGDLDTRVWVRDWEVVNGTYENRPLPQILERADETAALVGNHVCRGAAGVLSGRAQALALAGRRTEALAALREVGELTERMPAETAAATDSMLGWPEVRLHHTASYVYTHTGDTRRAMEAQDEALKLYPADLERERAQLRMHRATCMIHDGHIGDGLRYAADVLDELPPDRHNALLYEVARQVVAVVPQPERSRTEATDLGERISSLPSA